ncbi:MULTISPECIES: alanine/glycine:cation symporter family protein [Enterobacter cloacae complex]|uniref:alanine/glycine:cation symporter family protein n=1 Tax=Enterobacter cloacae complex TaxID=354276 RepID=UPI00079AF70C|nr:alanine/glycine:cation symporter family protein [Enterobacter hormaechei]MCM7401380.1 alanine:cation symporter family protein [Enterobacter hormaechei]MDY3570130.1 alanine/glycine:cation symporter family protein [Enterobacter hormaechei]NQD84747.1 alanine:cation symporter family protein [Enterobacter hormaechei]QGU37377.1 alanine:cation symporter family protein [Enterobacter hormaechei]QLO97708.1 alanine:cation symporter family protein [Enterobacter hormaechei]
MNELVSAINGVIWSPALIFLCLGVGLYFSLRSRFLQLRHIKHMITLMFQGGATDAGVSSFQALTMTLAGRVGTGNIAGVATAITFGGPGALFWMWVVAFLGASSAFVESTLGQVYKEKINGEYRGGPAFYIEKGLGVKWYAWLFAIVTIFSCGLLLPGVQANSIAASLDIAFGLNPNVTAAILAVLLSFIIFGGVKRIASFSSMVVPFMALGYIIVACVIIAINIEKLPSVILLIWKSAFGLEAGFGAILGQAIMWGVKRGVYSNEAAQGTGPHASSAAAVSHPVKQGLVQAFSVYIDTLFVCSATGFMLLITGLYNVQGVDGAALYTGIAGVAAGPGYVQTAMESMMPGFGNYFVAIALFFFAFTTIIAYYYIAETNIAYINRKIHRPWLTFLLKLCLMASTVYGTIRTADLAWGLGDIGVGLMAWLNIIAIVLLHKKAFASLKDYETQNAQGIDPQFDPVRLGIKNADYWLGERRDEEGGLPGQVSSPEGKQPAGKLNN